jgi:hypothetical protein
LAHIANDRNEGAGNTDINGKALALKIHEKEAAGPRDGAGNRHCALEKLLIQLSLEVRIYSLGLLYGHRSWAYCSALSGVRGDSSLDVVLRPKLEWGNATG